MSTNRKTYFSFEDACNSERTEQGMCTSNASVVGPKESRRKIVATILSVAAMTTAFAPSAHTPKPASENNHLACVADIIEQAKNETSPQFLCETMDLHMHKPMWLPSYKQLVGGNDIDDDVDYKTLPIQEYNMYAQLGSIEKGLPPVFAG